MHIELRPAAAKDFGFARALYFETMRSMIERLFGWDQAHQEDSFAGWFKIEEAEIILADGRDVGWMQRRIDDGAIFLGSLYILPEMQRRGIGTHILRTLLAEAEDRLTDLALAVMKINPALRLYQRLGFQITHEDEWKFYMRVRSASAVLEDGSGGLPGLTSERGGDVDPHATSLIARGR